MIVLLPFQARITRSLYTTLRNAFIELGYTASMSGLTNTSQYEAAQQAITTAKGFCVELFNEGSPQAKGLKKVPRVVIKVERILPGNIGFAAVAGYTENNSNGYDKQLYQNIMSSLFLNISYISNTAAQDRLMGSVIHQVIGSRKFIPYLYTYQNLSTPIVPNPNEAFLMEQVNYYDIGESPEGLMERIYEYKIQDVLTEYPETTSIAKIEEIITHPFFGDLPLVDSDQIIHPTE